MTTTEETVLTYLQTQDDFIPTLQIAKAVSQDPKDARCKDVNRLLYSLQKQQKATLLCRPDGSKPRWATWKGIEKQIE